MGDYKSQWLGLDYVLCVNMYLSYASHESWKYKQDLLRSVAIIS